MVLPVKHGNFSGSIWSMSRPPPLDTSPTHPNAWYVVAMISPNVAATGGSSRSWNTTTFGPGVFSRSSTWRDRPMYVSPPRGGAPARNVAVDANPTIGGSEG